MTLQERVHKVKPSEQWPLNKLHNVLRVRDNNKNIGMVNDNLLSLSYGRIVNKSIDTSEGLLPESFETYQIVQPGDIVMRLTDLQRDRSPNCVNQVLAYLGNGFPVVRLSPPNFG